MDVRGVDEGTKLRMNTRYPRGRTCGAAVFARNDPWANIM